MFDRKKHQEYMNLINQQTPGKYDCAGIYCIKIEDKIVYIGKSANIRERIASHLCNINKYSDESDSHKYDIFRQALQAHFTIGFDILYKSLETQEDLIKEDIGSKEGELIRKYRPVLNWQIPKEEDWHRYETNKQARTITLKQIVGNL